jgi:hypothetical protein
LQYNKYFYSLDILVVIMGETFTKLERHIRWRLGTLSLSLSLSLFLFLSSLFLSHFLIWKEQICLLGSIRRYTQPERERREMRKAKLDERVDVSFCFCIFTKVCLFVFLSKSLSVSVPFWGVVYFCFCLRVKREKTKKLDYSISYFAFWRKRKWLERKNRMTNRNISISCRSTYGKVTKWIT